MPFPRVSPFLSEAERMTVARLMSDAAKISQPINPYAEYDISKRGLSEVKVSLIDGKAIACRQGHVLDAVQQFRSLKALDTPEPLDQSEAALKKEAQMSSSGIEVKIQLGYLITGEGADGITRSKHEEEVEAAIEDVRHEYSQKLDTCQKNFAKAKKNAESYKLKLNIAQQAKQNLEKQLRVANQESNVHQSEVSELRAENEKLKQQLQNASKSDIYTGLQQKVARLKRERDAQRQTLDVYSHSKFQKLYLRYHAMKCAEVSQSKQREELLREKQPLKGAVLEQREKIGCLQQQLEAAHLAHINVQQSREVVNDQYRLNASFVAETLHELTNGAHRDGLTAVAEQLDHLLEAFRHPCVLQKHLNIAQEQALKAEEANVTLRLQIDELKGAVNSRDAEITQLRNEQDEYDVRMAETNGQFTDLQLSLKFMHERDEHIRSLRQEIFGVAALIDPVFSSAATGSQLWENLASYFTSYMDKKVKAIDLLQEYSSKVHLDHGLVKKLRDENSVLTDRLVRLGTECQRLYQDSGMPTDAAFEHEISSFAANKTNYQRLLDQGLLGEGGIGTWDAFGLDEYWVGRGDLRASEAECLGRPWPDPSPSTQPDRLADEMFDVPP